MIRNWEQLTATALRHACIHRALERLGRQSQAYLQHLATSPYLWDGEIAEGARLELERRAALEGT